MKKHQACLHQIIGASLGILIMAISPAARAADSVKLTVFAAGTLAVPFRALDEAFQKKYSGVDVQPQFGGSVKMAKQITELHQEADILAVADFSVIPKYLFAGEGKPALTTWYVGFARNAITFVYTDKSKYAREVTGQNWYQVLARPGVEIGRSDPDTDPSGYQTVQMLDLASRFYKDPQVSTKVLANASPKNLRDTETALISALQIGQIDYLAIYRSDALQHHLKFLALPAEINLSDPAHAKFYEQGVAHTKNGDLSGKPIVYAITIPSVAHHADWARKYIAMLLGPEGRQILAANGFGTFTPAYAVNADNVPPDLHPLVKPWPGS
ncbi:MAG TPA: extracellular solute-binding protein [Alphaproteobacteria bacterium]|nr:extracellular solute-binding protein [Alphaproteobacteria bacterium]